MAIKDVSDIAKPTRDNMYILSSMSLVCLATIEDVNMMKKEKVCEQCYETFFYVNKEKWIKGWRPKLKSKDN